MPLFSIFQQFPPTSKPASATLRKSAGGKSRSVRSVRAPRVARKAERALVGRWNCHACKSSFKRPVRGRSSRRRASRCKSGSWLSAWCCTPRKSLSSYQLGRDLDLTQRSAWLHAAAYRAAMTQGDRLLSGPW